MVHLLPAVDEESLAGCFHGDNPHPPAARQMSLLLSNSKHALKIWIGNWLTTAGIQMTEPVWTLQKIRLVSVGRVFEHNSHANITPRRNKEAKCVAEFPPLVPH